MLKKKIDIDTISGVTDIPVDQLEVLQAENQTDFDSEKK